MGKTAQIFLCTFAAYYNKMVDASRVPVQPAHVGLAKQQHPVASKLNYFSGRQNLRHHKQMHHARFSRRDI